MKGSPILATALACIIMLSMYVGMRVVFSQDGKLEESTFKQNDETELATQDSVTVYADLYVSNKPQSIRISHPDSGKKLLNLTDLEEFEWNGELQLPNLVQELELLCEVDWASESDGYQFIQLTLSPDNLSDQNQTLRSKGNITDIMNFHWKEATHE